MSLSQTRTTTVELQHRNLDDPNTESGQEIVYQQLKPADGGLDAWKVLIAAFLFEALMWGFPVCFGVFQEYYSHVPAFAGKNVAIIGTVAQGLVYVLAPLSTALVKRFPKFQRHFIWAGWIVCIVALGAGSLATQLAGLVATQGLMYGLGFVTLYWPIVSMVNEWWVARKGFAFGLIMGAAGAAGAILPFVFQALLNRYGYKTTLQATAVAMVILTGPLIAFCKPRLPASEQSTLAHMDWSFSKDVYFWTYTISTTIQGLGLFFPSIFLASYATDIGLNNMMGALLLSVLAVAQFAGQCVFGALSDRQSFSVTVLAMICSVMAAMAAFLLWGFGKSLVMLLFFSIVFGFFGYGFSSMRSAMARRITNDPTTLMALQSILNGSLGWGNILVGPISAKLIHNSKNKGGYGLSKYEDLIYFTGSCMLGSAVVLLLPYFRLLPRRM
ncbi:uncharacterized protein PV09_08921 [Verruconis gallopava]|uniref:Major facilitator superfamily (MFS) profile domain-containing protein n=1 Tax=Verruconis gallopava TaxID=253628 RepID=A0A0D1YF40_9PEZI|nr:uncharacterized protein PV09_08921 [Verruconis gallopava]KIV99376.1 hypothetical protein PV09_08921 [Verruconis gallopava]